MCHRELGRALHHVTQVAQAEIIPTKAPQAHAAPQERARHLRRAGQQRRTRVVLVALSPWRAERAEHVAQIVHRLRVTARRLAREAACEVHARDSRGRHEGGGGSAAGDQRDGLVVIVQCARHRLELMQRHQADGTARVVRRLVGLQPDGHRIVIHSTHVVAQRLR